MKKIILYSPQSFEYEAFKELEDQNEIEIKLILHWEEDDVKKLNKLFPKTPKLNCDELIKKGILGDYTKIDQKYFTRDVKVKYIAEEDAFIRMIDRTDSADNISYNERYNLYKFLMCKFFQILKEIDFSHFYSRCSPHEMVDFIVMRIFDSLGENLSTIKRWEGARK